MNLSKQYYVYHPWRLDRPLHVNQYFYSLFAHAHTRATNFPYVLYAWMSLDVLVRFPCNCSAAQVGSAYSH